MYLVDTPTGRHCTRHDKDLKRGEVCHECVTDPADAPHAEAGDEAYQRQLAARINEYRCNSRACLRRSDELADGTDREHGHAVKWNDNAIKWARLAEEQQTVLDNREHDLRLIRHEEAMSKVRN